MRLPEIISTAIDNLRRHNAWAAAAAEPPEQATWLLHCPEWDHGLVVAYKGRCPRCWGGETPSEEYEEPS